MTRPEEYWIQRGEDVIGTDVLSAGPLARQAAAYQGITDWITRLGVTEVLDVGCNVAALATFLRSAGWQGAYFGMDTNPFALDLVGEREDVELGDLRDLPVGNRMFQAVVVKDVIEHLESPAPLSEAFRAADQYVIVGTYLPWTDEPASIVRHADGYYTNRYRFTDIRDLAAGCDFFVDDIIWPNETNGQPNLLTLWKRDSE